MQLNQKYIQLFSDSLIPLLGFFYWDWSVYFIILFYFIDLLVSEIIMHLKSKSIQQNSDKTPLSKNWLFNGSLSLLIIVGILFLTHVGIYYHQTSIDFTTEIYNFWSYKELGIEQGYVLVPLVAVAAYMRYKMEFLVPKKFITSTHQSIWKPHLRINTLLLAGVVLGLTLLYFFVIPEFIILLAIVGLSSLVKYFLT